MNHLQQELGNYLAYHVPNFPNFYLPIFLTPGPSGGWWVEKINKCIRVLIFFFSICLPKWIFQQCFENTIQICSQARLSMIIKRWLCWFCVYTERSIPRSLLSYLLSQWENITFYILNLIVYFLTSMTQYVPSQTTTCIPEKLTWCCMCEVNIYWLIQSLR